MQVSEFIKYLKDLDPDAEVVMDMTKDGADMFHFVSLDVIERATLDDGQVVIVLSTEAPRIASDREINLN